MNLTTVSKFLALILRHKPEENGVYLVDKVPNDCFIRVTQLT